jgi:hypothetical protein
MAKAGTSALFSSLCQHPQIDFRGIKENFNFSHYDWSLSQYQNYYQSYSVSMNFCVAQWSMDSDQITKLNDVITHSSICLRNPWAFISSLYTFTQSYRHQSSEQFVDMMLETNQLDYAGIVSRWTKYCKKSFLILYYDDLVINQSAVCNQIINFLGLEEHQFKPEPPVNVTKETKHQIVYRKDQRDSINKLMTSAETYLNTDLTHWKQ